MATTTEKSTDLYAPTCISGTSYNVRRTLCHVHRRTWLYSPPWWELFADESDILDIYIYIYTFTNGNMTYVTNDVISTCHMSWRITKYHHLTSNDMFIYKSVHPQYTSWVSHVYGTMHTYIIRCTLYTVQCTVYFR